MTPESILRVLFGFVVLLARRHIFWLFIALVGFLVGSELARIWLVGQPMWLIISVVIAYVLARREQSRTDHQKIAYRSSH